MLGVWYVVGCKPTFLEYEPHNAIERYTAVYKKDSAAASGDVSKAKEDGSDIDYINVEFTFNKSSFTGSKTQIDQYLYPYPPEKGMLGGNSLFDQGKTGVIGGGLWVAQPKLAGMATPIKADYLVLDVGGKGPAFDASGKVADPYNYVVVGVPDRAYAWIMCRSTSMDAGLFKKLKGDLVEKFKYDLEGWVDVPNEDGLAA